MNPEPARTPGCAIERRWEGIELTRTPLGTGPTPLTRLDLDHVDDDVELWCKHEEAYGDGAWGGNKVRKLEWIIPEARRRGVRTLFTVGGIGTHWGLACARYGDEHGLRTVLGLVDQPVDDHVREQWARLEASPATIHRFSSQWQLRLAAPALMLRHAPGASTGRVPRLPWYLPAGGSNAFGTLGYVETGLEIAEQVERGEMPEPGTVVVPVGSGGTVAGLTLGLRVAGLSTRVLGVVVNDSLPLNAETLLELGNRTADLLRERGAAHVPHLAPSELTADASWLGATYGDPTPASVRMVAAASRAGLELEPVYTGKSLAAIADLGRSLRGPVLWLNTHGPR